MPRESASGTNVPRAAAAKRTQETREAASQAIQTVLSRVQPRRRLRGFGPPFVDGEVRPGARHAGKTTNREVERILLIVDMRLGDVEPPE